MGRLGLVDHDKVEVSNLHRQIIHTEADKGQKKVFSAAESCRGLNSDITVEPHEVKLTSENVAALVAQYDVIVDATDNPTSRYIINDACVFAAKPLVSGSAIGFEGQLTVYNYLPPPPTQVADAKRGPCYRCVYPKPPSGAAAPRCADNGVVGPVVGVIGSLQAMEAIKVLSGQGGVASGKITLYDARSCEFSSFKLRPRHKKCPVCGDDPSITCLEDSGAALASLSLCASAADPGADSPEGWDVSCGTVASSCKPRAVVLPGQALNGTETSGQEQTRSEGESEGSVLLDVRSSVQFSMCHLYGAVNIPYDGMADGTAKAQIEDVMAKLEPREPGQPKPSCYVICRRGHDSKLATALLRDMGHDTVYNVRGGLNQWAQEVDSDFPTY